MLEIGTGSGYQTAILSQLCRRVYTIERYRTLLRRPSERFKTLKLTNITHMVGDGTKGWPNQAPFERIIVTAPRKKVPPALLDQLAMAASWSFRSRCDPAGRRSNASSRTAMILILQGFSQFGFVPLLTGMPPEV